MKHLEVGKNCHRCFLYQIGTVWHHVIHEVRVVLQHESLGTFFESPAGGYRSARHGELHDSEVSAKRFALDFLRKARESDQQQISRLEKDLQADTVVG